MRVAIINLTAGGISGGYKQYLKNVIPRMVKDNRVNKLFCAVPVSIDLRNMQLSVEDGLALYSCEPFRLFKKDRKLLKEIEKFEPDILFIPVEKYFSYKKAPVVHMIQNMEPMISDINNSTYIRIKNWYQYLAAKKAICNSNRVIAVSKFVQDFLIDRWSIPSQKVGLVYHGINMSKTHYCQKRPDAVPQFWDEGFIFTAGSIRPARGLEDLLLSLEKIIKDNRQIKGLVVAGSCSPNMTTYKKELVQLATKKGIDKYICWTDSLNEAEMAWCYNNCLVFVMTSRVESFGLIGLEAMAHGCVTVCADNPAMPEVFGRSAIYYEPKNYYDLAEKVSSVLAWSEEKKNSFVIKAQKRALKFSWDFTAKRTVDEFVKAIKDYH